MIENVHILMTHRATMHIFSAVFSAEPLITLELTCPISHSLRAETYFQQELHKHFLSIACLGFQAGSITAFVACTLGTAKKGLESLRKAEMKLTTLESTICGGSLRIPTPGTNIFFSGKCFPFESFSSLAIEDAFVKAETELLSMPRLGDVSPQQQQLKYEIDTQGYSNIEEVEATTTATRAPLEKLQDQLRLLASFNRYGWDGECAEPVDDETLSLLNRVLPQTPIHLDVPTLQPVSDGRVDMIWDKAGLFCTVCEDEIVVHVLRKGQPQSKLHEFGSQENPFEYLVQLITQYVQEGITNNHE